MAEKHLSPRPLLRLGLVAAAVLAVVVTAGPGTAASRSSGDHDPLCAMFGVPVAALPEVRPSSGVIDRLEQTAKPYVLLQNSFDVAGST